MLYLDSPVTFNDVTFYRDFSDEKLFYYLPNDVLIGKDEEALHFTIFTDKTIKDEDKKDQDVRELGGFINLESVMGPDSNDMKDAIDALKGYAGQDVKVTPVPFEDGEVNLAVLGTSSKNKEKKDVMEIEIVAADKPCLNGNHQAAFNTRLGGDAAQIVYDLLNNTPQTQMAVFYKMDYLGVTPAYNLEITVDFEATEKYYNNKIDLDFDLEEKSMNLKVLVDADIDSVIQDLVDQGTITIKETDYTEGQRFNEGVTNQVELIKTLLGTELFNPTIMPTSPNAILKDTINSAGDNKDGKDAKDAKEQGKSGEGKDAKGDKDVKEQGKAENGNGGKSGGSIPDKKNDAIPEGGKKPGKTNPATNDNPTPEAPKSANPKATAPKGENPDGENPAGKNPTGENPTGENPDGENPDGENPGGKKPTGKKPTGENPDGENPDGENPDGENPDGENPGGKNPTDGDASTDGDNPDGKNPTDGDNSDGDNNGDDSNGGETDDKKKSELYITAKLGYTLRHRDLSEQKKRTFTFNRHEVKRMQFAISGILSTSESKFKPEEQVRIVNLGTEEFHKTIITFAPSLSYTEYGINSAIVDWHYQDMKLWDSVLLDKEDGVYKRSLYHNDEKDPNISYKASFITKDFGTVETEEMTTDKPRILVDLNNLAGKQFVKVRLGALGKRSDIIVKVMPDGKEAAMQSVCLSSENSVRPLLIDKCETYDVVVEYPQSSGQPQRVTYSKQTGKDFIVNNPYAVQVILDESAFADDTVKQIRVKISYNDGPSKMLVFTPSKLEASFVFDYEADTIQNCVIKTSYQKIHADRTIEDNGGEEYPGNTTEIYPIIF